ncbi:MAG: hypothetical protein VR71_22190 [Roseovarius sp. BRH_c41]|jgi:hypothetical protein|uniref:hypothetical protein n=1 Tax=Roseovarius sp. BRH_c41 TaxID=1629709 RepID=UPI0005F12A36|nr:hypothetical protein [Roseovarius sp. BRH_c41]KJS40698.1 MAG: hypothetical protein VR71_22190 [Roseovarius sp. BRH_c41]
MEIIADILMIAGTIGACLYCYVLARRLGRFNDLENGMGGAVAILSAQVDDLTTTLRDTRHTADESARTLKAVTDRAEDAARRLELLVASMHDLPDRGLASEPVTPMREYPQSAPSGPVFKRHQDMTREVSP